MNAHHEAADDAAEWAVSHPEICRAPRCTGNCGQGRASCECSTGHVMDRMPEDYEADDLPPAEAFRFWLWMSVFAVAGTLGVWWLVQVLLEVPHA